MKSIDDFRNETKTYRNENFRNMDMETLQEYIEDDSVLVEAVMDTNSDISIFTEFADDWTHCSLEGVKKFRNEELEIVYVSGIRYRGPLSIEILVEFMNRYDHAQETSSEINGVREDGTQVGYLRAWFG